MDLIVTEGVQAIFFTWMVLQGLLYFIAGFGVDLTHYGDSAK
jgi:hypothetical protein